MRSLKTAGFTAIRGLSLLLAGLAGAGAVLVAALFAVLLTLVLISTRPIVSALAKRSEQETRQPTPASASMRSSTVSALR